MNSKLCFEIIERIELVRRVEVFIIFPVRTLDLAVVSGRVRFDQLVPDATLFEASLKQRGRRILCVAQTLGELLSVIRLYALDLKWERFDQVLEKYGRAVGVLLLESL